MHCLPWRECSPGGGGKQGIRPIQSHGKTGTTPDDYATNDGYITTETAGNSTGGAQSDTTSGTAGISKENIKVGVLYISDPDEGSGYSYTHDLGIVGMQENLGLSDD